MKNDWQFNGFSDNFSNNSYQFDLNRAQSQLKMNIVQRQQRFEQNTLDKHSSKYSVSTSNGNGSPETESSSPLGSTTQPNSSHISNLPLQSSQMIQQKPKPRKLPVDIKLYLSKRPIVMAWIQRHCEQFNLTRNCSSLAHHIAELYFHNAIFQQKKAKLTLSALLILASKQSEQKILYTNHIAFICQLNQEQLNKKQLQCCCKLKFNLCIDTYTMFVDIILHQIKKNVGIDLYFEDQQCYVKLRMVHKIVERIFVDNYQWIVNEYDILLVFFRVFEKEIQQNEKFAKLMKKLRNKYMDNTIICQQEQNKMTKIINQYIEDWKGKNEKIVRELFKNRTNAKKYTTYEQFSIRYFFD